MLLPGCQSGAVRGLLDRKISEEHLQSSNENIRAKQDKMTKRKEKKRNSYLPHHLDLASEDSVGHSTCMIVLARRRATMGSIVQPKRSCLGLSRYCHVLVTVHAGASQGYVLGIPLYPTGRSST